MSRRFASLMVCAAVGVAMLCMRPTAALAVTFHDLTPSLSQFYYSTGVNASPSAPVSLCFASAVPYGTNYYGTSFWVDNGSDADFEHIDTLIGALPQPCPSLFPSESLCFSPSESVASGSLASTWYGGPLVSNGRTWDAGSTFRIFATGGGGGTGLYVRRESNRDAGSICYWSKASKVTGVTFQGWWYGTARNSLTFVPYSDSGFEFTLPSKASIVVPVFQYPAISSSAYASEYSVVSRWYFLNMFQVLYCDYSTESGLTEQTQQLGTDIADQTGSLLDTSGSDSVVGGATSGGVDGLSNRLGFIAQVPNLVTSFLAPISSASASDGVMFPGVTVLGTTLIPAQTVPIWQNGLAALETPIKAFNTGVLCVLFIKGAKHVFHKDLLGWDDDEGGTE